jgi:hypothetical protein
MTVRYSDSRPSDDRIAVMHKLNQKVSKMRAQGISAEDMIWDLQMTIRKIIEQSHSNNISIIDDILDR